MNVSEDVDKVSVSMSFTIFCFFDKDLNIASVRLIDKIVDRRLDIYQKNILFIVEKELFRTLTLMEVSPTDPASERTSVSVSMSIEVDIASIVITCRFFDFFR